MANKRLLASIVMLYLGAVAIGLGVAYGTGLFTANSTQSSSPYMVTLVETMNQWPLNTSLQQPAFYLLTSTGLQHLTTLTLPAKRTIQLTIVSYDMPTTGSNSQEGMVTGTVGGNMYLINGTQATPGNVTWGHTVSSVPSASIAHNFNIPQLNINIPVVGGSTVIANLYFDKSGGPYPWLCQTPCGLPSNLSGGAMATSGWMEGQLIIQ